MKQILTLLYLVLLLVYGQLNAQDHPRIYVTKEQKPVILERIERSEKVGVFIKELKKNLDPYVERHQTDPEWIVSRLQMYWKFKYKEVWVKGMDFSHGSGEAPVPTVRFSGSRDWATDYMRPNLEDVMPYMDDERGLYLQNEKKEGQPWEWVHPSETGHIIERINEEIMELASEAAFLYWVTGEKKYAIFANDIFLKYIEGMYHREPPQVVDDHRNKWLMGLQTFEVIHERIVEHLTICYDFLYSYLNENDANLIMIQDVFQKWADQEIKYGVPDNNWNLMQALYITYLALALEGDELYENGKGQEYYIDQVLNQNSFKQKALKDVVLNYDQNNGVWPEVAGYNMLVGNDMLEIFGLMDKALYNNLVEQYPIVEKANLVIFQYLFPNGYTVSYGDAKHSRIRFNALELLLANYRKYGLEEKEALITSQMKKFIAEGAYSREKISSLFQLFFYVDELMDVPSASSFSDLVTPTFYAPNVSWVVQRNGNSPENGMMVSKNASLGNHSHANGISLELYAKGMVIAPDCAAGVSYWSKDHSEYYSRFMAHNTVVVDGISDYNRMNSKFPFTLNSIYPLSENENTLFGDFTFSDVVFTEPKTGATQQRVTGTVRTGKESGYFVDIFRSAKPDGTDKKHEYLFHGQGDLGIYDFSNEPVLLAETNELSSKGGELAGYNYFTEKFGVSLEDNFIAQFEIPSVLGDILNVNLWLKGYKDRDVYTVKAPYSRAINKESVPEELYRKPLPTLVVRQNGEAGTRPFVAVIDAFNQDEGQSVKRVAYFQAKNENTGFVGLKVKSINERYDLIFNDRDPESINQFEHGKFVGSYGVISKVGKELKSMLLHNGTLFEHGNVSIEIPDHKGNVQLEFSSDSYVIEADQPFILSFPVDDSVQEASMKSSDNELGINFPAQIIQKENVKTAVFELPSLHRIKLNFHKTTKTN